MLSLFILLTIFILLALFILAIPFFKKNNANKKTVFYSSVFIILFSFVIYIKEGNLLSYDEWITHGQSHYQLQLKISQLGGIDTIIDTIKQKLEKNPNDAKGWYLLGKLYLGKQDREAAKIAFKRAKELELDKKK